MVEQYWKILNNYFQKIIIIDWKTKNFISTGYNTYACIYLSLCLEGEIGKLVKLECQQPCNKVNYVFRVKVDKMSLKDIILLK